MIRLLMIAAAVSLFSLPAQAVERRTLRLWGYEGREVHVSMPPGGGELVITAESAGSAITAEIEHPYGVECEIVSQRNFAWGDAEITVSFRPTGRPGTYASCDIMVETGRLNRVEAGAWLE